jgi:hypothetical protein
MNRLDFADDENMMPRMSTASVVVGETIPARPAAAEWTD